jgi:hypothetical protein
MKALLLNVAVAALFFTAGATSMLFAGDPAALHATWQG